MKPILPALVLSASLAFALACLPGCEITPQQAHHAVQGITAAADLPVPVPGWPLWCKVAAALAGAALGVGTHEGYHRIRSRRKKQPWPGKRRARA